MVAVDVDTTKRGLFGKGMPPMTATTTARSVAPDHRAFRTPSGVMVTAETLTSGVRLYSPILATWLRVMHDRKAA
ncbi:MAG TPA: hypothetical protein DIC59_05850 [Candidatus Competibacteraceae bacterium]|nr:hypothetical protein [Candidatus Competibacteraceae bacterium]